MIIHVVAPSEFTREEIPYELRLQADVVDSQVHVLISKGAPVRLCATLGFATNSLAILNSTAITLITTGFGHLQLPSARQMKHISRSRTQDHGIYPVNTDPGKDTISYEELKKIHLRLGHCSEFTLRNMLQAAKIAVPDAMIRRMLAQCTCGGKFLE